MSKITQSCWDDGLIEELPPVESGAIGSRRHPYRMLLAAGQLERVFSHDAPD